MSRLGSPVVRLLADAELALELVVKAVVPAQVEQVVVEAAAEEAEAPVDRAASLIHLLMLSPMKPLP